MYNITFGLLASIIAMSTIAHSTETLSPTPTPQYRPSFHFTPQAHWMNDPNGLVFHNGIYHLFFQHYPHAMVWGPMHWGHATSTDLLTWQEQPIALKPDELGMIFSGSVVIDAQNTSGLGKDGRAPWIAVFTHHDPVAEKANETHVESQSLAYSLDKGKTWTKYKNNPVLKNPGLRDFRDPKVFWHEASSTWLMSLATGDRIAFYSSPDLKNWHKQGEFGQDAGAHSGVWECPDLFPLTLNGKTRWVLLVSIARGGPAGGSATQYFIGDFDGKTFTPETKQTRWLDYGPDNYAGVTWHNTPGRALFIGWMSNWEYATKVPTAPWRSAMTLPRELTLRQVGKQTLLASLPAKETQALGGKRSALKVDAINGEIDFSKIVKQTKGRFSLEFRAPQLRDFTLALSNKMGDELHIGFDQKANEYFIDRRKAGLNEFNPAFASRHVAPHLADTPDADITLYFDATSVELFADGGITSMTSLFFPLEPYSNMTLKFADGLNPQGFYFSRRP